MAQLFGEKLRALRQERKMIQTELARMLGIGQGYITNLETGRDVASLDLIVRTAHTFGVTVDGLLRDTVPVEAITTPQQIAEAAPELSLRHFASNLRHLRITHNLTQQAFAQRVGVAQRFYISNLEAGRKWPSPELVVRIADIFGVTVDQLLRPFPEAVQES